MDNYLNILEESLRKKLVLLDEIQVHNLKQCEIFSAETVELAVFDEVIEEKGRLIEEITKLDEGFETLYANLSGQLQKERARYAAQIKVLQDLIRQVTEKSVTIQAQEARNKALIEAHFAREKKHIRDSRINSRVAYGYYKNLDKAVLEASRAFDFKK